MPRFKQTIRAATYIAACYCVFLLCEAASSAPTNRPEIFRRQGITLRWSVGFDSTEQAGTDDFSSQQGSEIT